MKCEENSIDACKYRIEFSYWRCDSDNVLPIDLYAEDISLEDLSIIKAMLAGEWKCGTCGTKHLDNPCPCSIDFPDSRPCGFWQPREETR